MPGIPSRDGEVTRIRVKSGDMNRLRAIAASLGLGVTVLSAHAAGPDAPLGIVEFANPAQPSFYRVLDDRQAARVALGQSVFNTQWVPGGSGGVEEAGRRQGLGPLYNATACATCHPGGARGPGPRGNGP